MARLILVHGAFNEFWGPHELKARWLPALRDGLWHHDVEIDDADVEVCFYGDLFRRMPGTDREHRLEQSRPGIAESLTELAGDGAIAALSQAAGDAVFDRTVDMVTVMATEPDLRARLRARIEPLIDDKTRVIVAHSLGTVLSYTALCNHPDWPVKTLVTLGSPLASPMILSTLEPPRSMATGLGPVRSIAGSTSAPSATRPPPSRSVTPSVPASRSCSSTTATGPTHPSLTSTQR